MLRVSNNRHYLVHDDGTPFFYLSDTGWAVLQRLDRAQTERYLADRAAKGFTVVQTVIISEFDGLTVPNRAGALPLIDADPDRPNEDYFAHVDSVVDTAAALGLYVALLPTWGDLVGPVQWGTGQEIFTPENARCYGEFLGERYRDRQVIWMVGGDRNPVEPRHFATWTALAEGLERGGMGRHLRTFHPQGGRSSADFFHDAPWLDFNIIQSGHHARNIANYRMIAQDYARVPIKPCTDGEACYEDHPVNWKPELGYFDAHDVRQSAYWALFAGAHGHTYGANGIFQCTEHGESDRFHPRKSWEEALSLPGAAQMQHARALLLSRPFLTRIPDQTLLAASSKVEDAPHIAATRDTDGSYAMFYAPTGQPITVDVTRLSGTAVRGWWFDPRDGTAHALGTIDRSTATTFEPPSQGPEEDWVLVLDDAAQERAAPGRAVL